MAKFKSRARPRRAGKAANRPVTGTADQAGPIPDPAANLLLADVALRGGGLLLRRGIERGLLKTRTSSAVAKQIVNNRSMSKTLFGAAIARVATRSIPGAIFVGGGMLAKAIYDRRKQRKAETGSPRRSRTRNTGEEDIPES